MAYYGDPGIRRFSVDDEEQDNLARRLERALESSAAPNTVNAGGIATPSPRVLASEGGVPSGPPVNVGAGTALTSNVPDATTATSEPIYRLSGDESPPVTAPVTTMPTEPQAPTASKTSPGSSTDDFYANLEQRYNRYLEGQRQESFRTRSLPGHLYSAIAGGAMEGLQRGIQAVQPLIEEPGEPGFVGGLARSLKEYQEESPTLQQSTELGTVGKAVYGGIRSAAQSATAMVPGAVAGTIAGAGPWGTVVGAAMSGGTIFGLSQYQDVMDRGIEHWTKQGLNKQQAIEKVQPEAIWQGVVEGGFEFASDLLMGKIMGADKLLVGPAKEATKVAIRDLTKTGFKDLAKRYAATAVTETGTEMVQSGLEAQSDVRLGIGNQGFWDAATEAFGPALVASFIFGGLGHVNTKIGQRGLLNALENPNTKPEIRNAAVEEVYATLQQYNPTVADVWGQHAMEALRRGQSISTDEDLMQLQERIANLEAVKRRSAEQEANLKRYREDFEASLERKALPAPEERLGLPAPEGYVAGEGFEMRPTPSYEQYSPELAATQQGMRFALPPGQGFAMRDPGEVYGAYSPEMASEMARQRLGLPAPERGFTARRPEDVYAPYSPELAAQQRTAGQPTLPAGQGFELAAGETSAQRLNLVNAHLTDMTARADAYVSLISKISNPARREHFTQRLGELRTQIEANQALRTQLEKTLREGVAEEVTQGAIDDRQGQKGLPSAVGIGEKPGGAVPVGGPGTEAVGGNRSDKTYAEPREAPLGRPLASAPEVILDRGLGQVESAGGFGQTATGIDQRFGGDNQAEASAPYAGPERRRRDVANEAFRASLEGKNADELREILLALHGEHHTDDLTGLPNVKAYHRDLTGTETNRQQTGKQYAFGIADIDDFKDFNTRHGHDGGDQAIAHYAKALEESALPGVEVYRLHGDEIHFLADNADDIIKTVDAAREKLQKVPIVTVDPKTGQETRHEVSVPFSIGAADTAEGADFKQTKAQADANNKADKDARKELGLRKGERDIVGSDATAPGGDQDILLGAERGGTQGTAGVAGEVSQATAPAEPVRVGEKQPWEMTRDEWAESRRLPLERERGETSTHPVRMAPHGVAVANALAEGKPVSAEVLKDYPGFAKKYGKTIEEATNVQEEKVTEEAQAKQAAEVVPTEAPTAISEEQKRAAEAEFLKTADLSHDVSVPITENGEDTGRTVTMTAEEALRDCNDESDLYSRILGCIG